MENQRAYSAIQHTTYKTYFLRHTGKGYYFYSQLLPEVIMPTQEAYAIAAHLRSCRVIAIVEN